MDQKERMLAGLPYKAWMDGLQEERDACRAKIYAFNLLPPENRRTTIPAHIREIFGKAGENVWVEPPFQCDYGWNIEVGDNFYANYNLVILDVCKVTIGDNVFIAPNGLTDQLLRRGRRQGVDFVKVIGHGPNLRSLHKM